MELYGYWRSSASYRVRIALALKGLEYQYRAVHLLNNGGEQKEATYTALNPAQLVPTLSVTVAGETVHLHQSLAIIEYLDATYPQARLIPEQPLAAATVRALALDMAADLQPITNLRVLQYLTGTLQQADGAKTAWIGHWVHRAFSAFEQRLTVTAGQYCVGDTISLADVCLMPQVYNAQRFGVDLSAYPHIQAIAARLAEHPAFIAAAPEQQPDAQN